MYTSIYTYTYILYTLYHFGAELDGVRHVPVSPVKLAYLAPLAASQPVPVCSWGAEPTQLLEGNRRAKRMGRTKGSGKDLEGETGRFWGGWT